MPKIKVGKEFDEKELDVEYSENDFVEYEGELPSRGKILRGRIKRLWYTISSNDNPMFRVLWEAEGNTGENAEFNGLPIWDNITFTPKAAFRYGPFLKLFGITLADVKTRMIGGDEDNVGVPVEKVGKWTIDSNASYCRVVVKHERYEGEKQAKANRYLPDDDGGVPNDGDGGKKAKKDKTGGKKKGKKEQPF